MDKIFPGIQLKVNVTITMTEIDKRTVKQNMRLSATLKNYSE